MGLEYLDLQLLPCSQNGVSLYKVSNRPIGQEGPVLHSDEGRLHTIRWLITELDLHSGAKLRDFYIYLSDLYECVISPVTVFKAPGDMPLADMRMNALSGLRAQIEMIRLLFTSAEKIESAVESPAWLNAKQHAYGEPMSEVLLVF